MSFGAPTPIEVAVSGPDLEANRTYAETIVAKLRGIRSLRDVQLGELLNYPTLDIEVDRERAAQLGVTVADVGRALAPATWSSRFTTPVYWADPKSGIAYQVQVETPQARISSIDDIASLPVKANHVSPTLLRDVAQRRRRHGLRRISPQQHAAHDHGRCQRRRQRSRLRRRRDLFRAARHCPNRRAA